LRSMSLSQTSVFRQAAFQNLETWSPISICLRGLDHPRITAGENCIMALIYLTVPTKIGTGLIFQNWISQG